MYKASFIMDRLTLDPLTDIVRLLRPRNVLLGSMVASGRWGIRLPQLPGPTFYFVIEGECLFQANSCDLVELKAGDYVLSAKPQTDSFFSEPGVRTVLSDTGFKASYSVDGELRIGDLENSSPTRTIGGLILCDPANADLLLGQLPQFIHVRASEDTGVRLRALISIIREEANEARPGREAILSRLIGVMLIETLRREAAAWSSHVGLLGGLADPRLARALANIHADIGRGWTVADLARQAGMSRSLFTRRFSEAVGAPPVEYLLGWRMALAKDALLNTRGTLDEIAEAVGYKSASAFSTAFSHRVGLPPSDYAARFRARTLIDTAS
jgi:AraC-like DNA-binding protein